MASKSEAPAGAGLNTCEKLLQSLKLPSGMVYKEVTHCFKARSSRLAGITKRFRMASMYEASAWPGLQKGYTWLQRVKLPPGLVYKEITHGFKV